MPFAQILEAGVAGRERREAQGGWAWESHLPRLEVSTGGWDPRLWEIPLYSQAGHMQWPLVMLAP